MHIEHLQQLPAAPYGCNECDLVAVVDGRRIKFYERAGQHPRRIVATQGNDLERAFACKKYPLRGASSTHRRPEGDLVGVIERWSRVTGELRQHAATRYGIPDRRHLDDARAYVEKYPFRLSAVEYACIERDMAARVDGGHDRLRRDIEPVKVAAGWGRLAACNDKMQARGDRRGCRRADDRG